MVEKKTIGVNYGEFLVEVTDEDFDEILNALSVAKLECPKCSQEFWIKGDYEGIITCPYCGELVEQP